MARRARDDDDDSPRRSKRRPPKPDRTWLIVGASLAGVVVVVVAVLLIANARSKQNVKEVTNEEGATVVTVKSPDGDATVSQIVGPADGRPYGIRFDENSIRPDTTVLPEAWKLLRGRWERTGPKGEQYVAEFRDDHSATVSIVYAEGLRTMEYKLKCVTDHTQFRDSGPDARRAYSLDLRHTDQSDLVTRFDCVILKDGTLATGDRGHRTPYRRVR